MEDINDLEPQPLFRPWKDRSRNEIIVTIFLGLLMGLLVLLMWGLFR